MKESLWGYWLTILGIGISAVMILLQNYTTTNQQDYYLAKEVTYAAMYDAIDYGYYKKHGELKIVKEKFVENFVRRFAQNATLNKTYTLNFYTIYEVPPAVSIEIKSSGGEFRFGSESADSNVTTRLTAILELNGAAGINASGDVETIYPPQTPMTPNTNMTTTTTTTTTVPTPIEFFVEGEFYDLPYGSFEKGVSSIFTLSSSVKHYELLSQLRGNVEAAGLEWKGKVKISVESAETILPSSSSQANTIYNNYVSYHLCENDKSNCKGHYESGFIENAENLTYVPHSILYKLKNEGKLHKYFATNNILNNTLVGKNTTHTITDTATYGFDISWSGTPTCNEVFDEELGIKSHRKKFKEIFDESAYSPKSDWNSKGLFSPYDYIYDTNASSYIDAGSANAIYGWAEAARMGTPYYKKCIVGMKFKIKYEFIKS